MKFIVEIENFWLEEDGGGLDEQLKSSIRADVVNEIKKSLYLEIQEKISAVVKKQVKEFLHDGIQAKVEEYIKTGLINKSSYSNDQITIEEWIKSELTGTSKYNNTHDKIKKLADEFGNELKQRYDLLFASQIVAKLNDNGLLKEDMAKILLQETKTKKI